MDVEIFGLDFDTSFEVIDLSNFTFLMQLFSYIYPILCILSGLNFVFREQG